MRSARLGQPAVQRYFPAAIYRADDRPLNPGDKGVVVTIENLTTKPAISWAPASQSRLWHGSDVGHGVISRRVFFTSMP